jgi:uncharacterized protein
MTPFLQTKLDHLQNILRQLGSVLVAYSGGVDSALVLAVAKQVLDGKLLACIGVSPSYPQREQREAIALAQQIGAPYRLIQTGEHLDPSYAANPGNRCYFCKSDLYQRIAQIAQQEGWGAIVDGNNADDLGDDRPGMTAAHQKGVRSPLLEAGISKAEVRALAKDLGLAVWDKPAMACLSSRIPAGTPITAQLLKQIEAAEEVLAELGLKQFRVRHHGEVARIEVRQEDLSRVLEMRQQIVAGVRKAGYRHVTLDLGGFRRET